MGDSGESLEEPTEMQTLKDILMEFQMGMRILLEIGVEGTLVTPWQRIGMHFVPALRLEGG